MASQSNIFSLANKSLKLDTVDDLAPYTQPLSSSTSITEVYLNGNTLGAPAATALAPLLSFQPLLETANLADLFTGRLLSEIPPAISALLTALLKCPKLHTIDLSDNAFGLNTVEPLVAFLKDAVPLRHLILNNNGLGPRAGALVAEALVQLAENKRAARARGEDVPELETIVCGRNRLEAASMAGWAAAYGALGTVKTVRMVQNGIRQEGVILLIREGLSKCPGLRVVDLQDNTFTKTGSLALAEVLPTWTELEELGVGDSLLGARGGVVLGETLQKGANKKLVTLKAQYNEIDAKGAQAITKAVEDGNLPALKRVELNGNKFSEDDEVVDKLRELLGDRRREAGADSDDEGWGLDELSDMEEESDEEDEGSDAEDEEEKEAKAEKVLEEADQEEGEKVLEKKDKDVDDLADALNKTL
ncbi:MAG: hypothetical protein MMC23_009042 [Stictis urceolatum]|nr:hypothetical protein [Stictis urceolata]